MESLGAKAEQERLVARLARLRDQRDDLRLELKPMAVNDAARTPLEVKLGPIEQEIQTIDIELQHHEAAASDYRVASEKHAHAKKAHEKMFEQMERFQSVFNSMTDYIAIQERATPAFETVEDWKFPIAIGAIGGGLFGASLGLLLSLIFVRPAPPQIPSAL